MSMNMHKANGKKRDRSKTAKKQWQVPAALPVELKLADKKEAPMSCDFSTLQQRRKGLEFVYPRDTAHPSRKVPFVFKTSANGNKAPVNANADADTDKHFGGGGSPDQLLEGPSSKKTRETIDDILTGKRASTKDASRNQVLNSSDNNIQSAVEHELEHGHDKTSRAGKLSGYSVEDAVKDKTGCRPRANSTDGELNLPRRGLCDEGMVLNSHKWSDWQQKTPKGFVNLGNTCFLNATLQCLAYIPPFCQILTSLEVNLEKLSQGQRITDHLRRLFRRVHDLDLSNANGSSGGSIAPKQIVKAVPKLGSIGSRNGHKFRPGRQEDAHEFLVHLLDAMQDGELRAAGINQHAQGWRDRLPIPRLDETTFVHRVFGGYLRSQVRCTKCGYLSNTYDPFLDLALEVSKKSSTSIASAFQEFSRKETLDKNNRWRCPGCRKDVCATKQLTVFRPPLSLCIQLKRFTFSNGHSFGNFSGYPNGMRFMGMGGGGGSKINKAIEFPAHLKLPLSDGRKCEYALTGIVVHLGSNPASGHYTAFVRKPGLEGKSKWYHMDDSFVELVSEKTVLKQKDAYVLFYCRTEVKLELPSPPLRTSMTTEQAKELNTMRSKSRVRSPSFSSESPLPPVTERPLPRVVGLSQNGDKNGKIAVAKPEEVIVPEDNTSVDSEASEPEVESSEKEDNRENKKTVSSDKTSKEGDNSSEISAQVIAQPRVTKTEKVEGSALPGKKTRIVLDRGTAHGKLEVMIGPRRKAKKAWKPKTTVTRVPDEKLELLGSKGILKWEDEDVVELPVNSRKEVVTAMEKEEKVRKKSMLLDRWDSMLDQGKMKKVKTGEKALPFTPISDTKSNPFHRIQSGMQSMNRGRAKGLHRQDKKGAVPHKKGKTKPNFKKHKKF